VTVLTEYDYVSNVCGDRCGVKIISPPGAGENRLKVTKEKSEEHYRAILESASRHFRERGFDAPSVSEIMIDAGLTHGAFYGHFRSKADLAASACRIAFEDRLSAWTSDISLSSYLDRYISAAHRDNRGKGCPMPAFASGIDNQDKALQREYARGVADYIERIAGRLVDDGVSRLQAKKHAIGIVAAMVGGIVMARATVSNHQLSADVIASARSSIAARFST